MKYLPIIIFIVLLSLGAYYYVVQNNPYSNSTRITPIGKVHSLNLSSTAFKNNNKIPAKYTCDDIGTNPPFSFEGVPQDSKSLVLIMEDLDSKPQNFTHWILFNMSPFLTGIDENFNLNNIQEGINDYKDVNYGPICPSFGNHRYIFKLYALDTILNLPNGAKKSDIIQELKGHLLDQAQLIGFYQKN